jgi:hypothetical protein
VQIRTEHGGLSGKGKNNHMYLYETVFQA